MSPLIARRLDVPPNLEGDFLINVNFCNRVDVTSKLWEQRVIEDLESELDGIGIGKIGHQNKKRNGKQMWKNEQQSNVKSGGKKGAE